MIHKKTFVNGELNDNHQLEYTHNLGTQDLVPSWKDENGVFRIIGDLFQVIDDNNIILSCNEPVTGTQTLYLEYDPAGASASGRRLFELTTTDDPDESLRIAIGKASTPASNVTLSSFLTWLFTKLGFLKVTNNLSDLNNVASARGNLAVYSSAQVDAYLAQKATLYQAGSGSVLGVANTSIFKPTSNYHPACLRDVKNLGMKPILAGQISSGDGSFTEKFRNSDVLSGAAIGGRTAAGIYTLTHNFGSNDYMIFGQCVNETNKQVVVTEIDKGNEVATIHVYDLNSADDSAVDIIMFVFNSYTA